VLSSELFHERLPDLRGVVRGIVERAEKRYADERGVYEESLKEAVNDLEADPDWTRLLDDDRQEIAVKLTCDMPETSADEDPIRLLQTLLVRKRTLPGLMEELREEVKRRRPADPEPEADNDGEEIIEADALVQPVVIATAEELDSWLNLLRQKLSDLLKSNKRIRIKGRK
jgi:hypothetical protein